MVGAMAPSSRFLTEKMLDNVSFNESKVFIELGPGTGVITKRIIERMPEDGILLVFELNSEFYQALEQKIDDPRVKLIHDSAEHIEKYLEKFQLEYVDAVISSLPLAVFSHELRSNIVHAAMKSLKSNGKYIQFQYSLQSKNFLKKMFDTVTIDFTPLNFPPAFVYTCTKN